MKRLLIAALLCVIACAKSFAAEPVYADSQLTVSPLHPGVWVVETHDKTTMYIVEGAERALLIDTGTDCTALPEMIQKITTKPYDVVLTHAHYDHAGGVSQFAEVYMHPADSVLIPTGPMRDYAGRINYIEEGYRFDLGGRQLEAVLLPGHTPGSIALIDYDNGMAFTGDAFGSGQVWLQLEPLIPITTYIRSCMKMMRIMEHRGIERLYVGHYPYPKRPLDMAYMQDMLTLAHRVAAGDTSDAVPLYENDPKIGGMLVRYGQAEILYKGRKIDARY